MDKPRQPLQEPPISEEDRARVLGWRVHFLEVVVLCYFLGYVMNFVVTLQFVYARIVDNIEKENNVTLNNTNSNSHCSPSSVDNTTAMITEQAQNIASSWQLYLSLVSGIPSIFASIMLGSFSDQIGRKTLFILPALGALVRTITYCLVSYFRLPLFYLLIGHGIEGCTGSFVTTLVASFAFSSDTTGRGNKRSLQITIMESTFGIAMGIANLSLGFMIKVWGYTLSTFPIMVVNLSTALIAAFLLPETRKKDAKAARPSVGQAVYRVYRFYISTKDDNPRGCYLVCLALFTISSLAFVGTTGVETLYVLNEPLCWSSVQIGYYNATKALCQSFATVILVKLLQFCLSDAGIGIVAGLSRASAVILEGFATKSFYMYIVAVIGMSGIAVLAMVRSIMSKLTPKDQLGAMFASIASVEAVTNMTASMVFVAIYQQTLTFYDGTVFFVMAVLIGISMILYGVLHFKLKRRERAQQSVITINDDRRPLLGYRETYDGY